MDDAVVASILGCEVVDFEERNRFASLLGLDAVCVQPRLSPSAGCGLPRAEELDWPDLGRWARDSDRFVFAMLDGAFGWGTRLLGMETFLLTAQRNALEMVKFVHQVEALNLDLIRRASVAGAMGIVIADDFAYQQGLLVSPGLMRSLFFPSLARQVEAAHLSGVPVFLHCDGNINSVLNDLVHLGLDGLQAIEAAAGMDLRGVKEQCGASLCLWGNLDPRLLLPPQDLERLRQAAGLITSVAGPEGGLIFGTSSGLFAGMSADSIRELYPLK